MKKGTELEYQEFKRLELEKISASEFMKYRINRHMNDLNDYDAAVDKALEDATPAFDDYAGKKIDFWERMRSKYSLDPSCDYTMNPQQCFVAVGMAVSLGALE